MNHTPPRLSPREHSLLDGEAGAATRLAMRIVVRMGEILGARELVEITSARPSTFSKDRYNAVSTLYFNAVHSILTGEEDAEVALELLELDLADLLDG